MPSATSVNRSRFQWLRHRSRTMPGIAVGFSREYHSVRGSMSSSSAPSSRSGSRMYDGPRKLPSGSASFLSRVTDAITARPPIRRAVPTIRA